MLDFVFIHNGTADFQGLLKKVPWATEVVANGWKQGLEAAATCSITTQFWYLFGDELLVDNLPETVRGYIPNPHEPNIVTHVDTRFWGLANKKSKPDDPIYRNIEGKVTRLERKYDAFYICTDDDYNPENLKTASDFGCLPTVVKNAGSIHDSHVKAASLSKTSWFWVLDGDCCLVRNLPYEDFETLDMIEPCTRFWTAENPTGGLVEAYGHGALKLMHKDLVLASDGLVQDFTTSVGDNFFHKTVTNIHAFDTSGFSIFKTVIREMCKLKRQKDEDSSRRLEQWTNFAGTEKLNVDLLQSLPFASVNDFVLIRKMYEDSRR